MFQRNSKFVEYKPRVGKPCKNCPHAHWDHGYFDFKYQNCYLCECKQFEDATTGPFSKSPSTPETPPPRE